MPCCNYVQSRPRKFICIIDYICISALFNNLRSPSFHYLSLEFICWAAWDSSRCDFAFQLILKRFFACFGAVDVKKTSIPKTSWTDSGCYRTGWFQTTNHGFLFKQETSCLNTKPVAFHFFIWIFNSYPVLHLDAPVILLTRSNIVFGFNFLKHLIIRPWKILRRKNVISQIQIQRRLI